MQLGRKPQTKRQCGSLGDCRRGKLQCAPPGSGGGGTGRQGIAASESPSRGEGAGVRVHQLPSILASRLLLGTRTCWLSGLTSVWTGHVQVARKAAGGELQVLTVASVGGQSAQEGGALGRRVAQSLAERLLYM